MKTFEPPSLNADAPSSSDGEREFKEVTDLPKARRTAVLSLLPGLGQLRNGEIAKGWLFLSVTLANIVLVGLLIWGDALRQPLTDLAHQFQRQPNWMLSDPLKSGLLQGPVLAVYALLVLTFIAYAVRDAHDRAIVQMRYGEPLPRARLTLPEATSGSYLVHLAVMVAFSLLIVLFVTPYTHTTQITDIVFDTKKPEPKKPKPAPKRVEQKKVVIPPKPIVKPKAVIKPVEHPQPVKVAPPKPNPVAIAVPTNQPTTLSAAAPIESSAPPPSGSATGNSNGSGQAGDGDAEVDMGPYMKELQRRIKAHWYPPKGTENSRIKVSFKVFRDGHITKLKLITSSEVGTADDAALQAVKEASPFAKLPDGVGDDIDINFTFDYHVFGSGGVHGF